MRNHFFLSAVVCTISALLVFSCKKEATIESSVINEAKTWFTIVVLAKENALLAKPYNEISKSSPERVLARMNRLSEKLDWANARTNSVDGLEYTIVPLQKDVLKLENNFFVKRAFIFFKKNGAPLQLEVVELLTREKEIISVIDVASVAFENKISNTINSAQSGDVQVFFYDKKYNPLPAYEIKTNNWNPLAASCVNKVNVKAGQPSFESIGEGNCMQWGVFRVTYDEYGNITEEELLYTYWIGDCPNGGVDPNEQPEPTGGGGEEAPPVVNLMNDPCKTAALNAITSVSNINNMITSFYTNTILPSNSPISVTFVEDNAITNPAQSINLAGSNYWMVKLNNGFSYTGGAMSQQAWGAIIAHEILHIYLANSNIDPIMQNNSGHHMQIFTNFINTTSNLLQSSFGINPTDATKLALNGLSDLWRWDNFDLLSNSVYGYSLSQIQAAYLSYTLGGMGTRCN